ncbi:MAG: oligosaccharide flippase family protein, partial [Armatimonadota bacterium]
MIQRLPLKQHVLALYTAQQSSLQNFASLVFSNFTAQLLFFLTTVKLAIVLGDAYFGLFSYGLAIGAYGSAFIRFGLERTLVRDLVQHPERCARLVLASLYLRGLLLAVFIIAVIATGVSLPSADFHPGVLLIIAATALQAMDLQPLFDAWHQMGRHGIYSLLQRLLYLILIWGVILFAADRLSLSVVGAILLFSQIVILVVQGQWALRRITDWDNRGKVWPEMWALARGSYWVWLATLIGLSFFALPQILLKNYAGAAALGGYAAAWQLCNAALQVIMQLGRVGNPKMAEVMREGVPFIDRVRFLARYSGVVMLVTLPVALAFICFPGQLMQLFFKGHFSAYSTVLAVFGWHLIVFAISISVAQYVITAHLENRYFAAVLAGGVVSIAVGLSAIPHWHAVGAAVMIISGYLVSFVIYGVVTAIDLERIR